MKTEINTFIETAITEILQGVASAHEYIRIENDYSKTGALNPYYEDDYDHSRKELMRYNF